MRRDNLVMLKGYSIKLRNKLLRSHSFRNSTDRKADKSVSLEN